MKLAWLTDIHLNFLRTPEVNRFVNQVATVETDAIVITGDIGEADSLNRYLSAFDGASSVPVYFVLGNHDYYGGSVQTVRNDVATLTNGSRHLAYLSTAGVIRLTDTTCLLGHDGWADGRLGDFAGSGVLLNDFFLIDELKAKAGQIQIGSPKPRWLQAMQTLAQQAADHFIQYLPEALPGFHHVIIATHVPPFKEACRHEGGVSSDDHLPYFASQTVGEVLKAHMARYPDRGMTVLCGHTHGNGVAQILPNLTVLTGGAEYGRPTIQRVLDLD